MVKGTENYVAGSGSDNTIVAVFDSYSDAKKAEDALLAEGFQRQQVQLNPESDASVSANPSDNRTTGATTTASTASDRDKHSGIMGFFHSLFGTDEDNREYRDVYSESVRRGHCIMTIDANSEEQLNRASQVVQRFNVVDIDERRDAWKQQGWKGYDASAPRYTQDEIRRDRESYLGTRTSAAAARGTGTAARASGTTEQTRIPVVEEELKVGKREVQRGGVRVFKRVQDKPVHESVQLRDEKVKVERRPVDKAATQADLDAFKEGSVELRESAEEAVVRKDARVVEEVVVGKEVRNRTEQINDTVRRTDVDVEQLGASGASGRFDDDKDFRTHWQTNYGSSGGRYEDYAPAYSFGSSMAGNERYRNRQWEEVEPQLRSDWESSHPESTWDKVKDAVRYGSQRMTGSARRY